MNNSKKVALLVIDIQKGLFDKSMPVYNAEQFLENVISLIDRAHQSNIPVFFIQHNNKSFLAQGSDGWQLHPQIRPSEGDILISKNHSSSFEKTPLKKMLEARNIDQLVITGMVTHGCVKAACLAAHQLGYKVILVEDGHSHFNKEGKALVEEWNRKLSAEGIVELSLTQAVDFDQS